MNGILYEDYVDTINARCYSLAKITGTNVSDLQSAASYRFLKARESWNPEGGMSFRSWLCQYLIPLRDEARKLDLPPALPRDKETGEEIFTDHPDMKTTITPYDSLRLKDSLNNLSEEAKEVVDIILEGPTEILGIEPDSEPRHVVGALKRHLNIHEKDWRIWKSIKEEIAEALRS